MEVWLVYVTVSDEFDGKETFAMVFDSPDKAKAEVARRFEQSAKAYNNEFGGYVLEENDEEHFIMLSDWCDTDYAEVFICKQEVL